jgi:hypothetical protein
MHQDPRAQGSLHLVVNSLLQARKSINARCSEAGSSRGWHRCAEIQELKLTNATQRDPSLASPAAEIFPAGESFLACTSHRRTQNGLARHASVQKAPCRTPFAARYWSLSRSPIRPSTPSARLPRRPVDPDRGPAPDPHHARPDPGRVALPPSRRPPRRTDARPAHRTAAGPAEVSSCGWHPGLQPTRPGRHDHARKGRRRRPDRPPPHDSTDTVLTVAAAINTQEVTRHKAYGTMNRTTG